MLRIAVARSWLCDMLCTSGFVDDTMFSQNGLYGATHSETATAKYPKLYQII